MKNSQRELIEHALDIAVESASNGGGPFGAVLVMPAGERPGRVYSDHNHVTAHCDPTAHAEVSVIRQAAKEEKTFDLSGAVLYSSCEPCPMCLASALWARVTHIYYAADRYQAAEAGFDDLAFYDKLQIQTPRDYVTKLEIETATAPFQAWANNTNRILY